MSDTLVISSSADFKADFSEETDQCFLSAVGDGSSKANCFENYDFAIFVNPEFIENQNSVLVFGEDSSLAAKDMMKDTPEGGNSINRELLFDEDISEYIKKLPCNYSAVRYDGSWLTDILHLDWVKALNEQNLIFTRNGLIYVRLNDGIVPLSKDDVIIFDSETNRPVTVLEQVKVMREKAIEREEPLAGEIYEHANGKHYEVLSIAVNHENPEIHRVIYRQVDGDGIIWSRTVDDFLGEIDREKYPNHPFNYRFQKVK